jgi:hypothetical protein
MLVDGKCLTSGCVLGYYQSIGCSPVETMDLLWCLAAGAAVVMTNAARLSLMGLNERSHLALLKFNSSERFHESWDESFQ